MSKEVFVEIYASLGSDMAIKIYNMYKMYI